MEIEWKSTWDVNTVQWGNPRNSFQQKQNQKSGAQAGREAARDWTGHGEHSQRSIPCGTQFLSWAPGKPAPFELCKEDEQKFHLIPEALPAIQHRSWARLPWGTFSFHSDWLSHSSSLLALRNKKTFYSLRDKCWSTGKRHTSQFLSLCAPRTNLQFPWI